MQEKAAMLLEHPCQIVRRVLQVNIKMHRVRQSVQNVLQVNIIQIPMLLNVTVFSAITKAWYLNIVLLCLFVLLSLRNHTTPRGNDEDDVLLSWSLLKYWRCSCPGSFFQSRGALSLTNRKVFGSLICHWSKCYIAKVGPMLIQVKGRLQSICSSIRFISMYFPSSISNHQCGRIKCNSSTIIKNNIFSRHIDRAELQYTTVNIKNRKYWFKSKCGLPYDVHIHDVVYWLAAANVQNHYLRTKFA